MTRSIDNHGIGALYATFSIHKTGSVCDLNESHIGNAVILSGNNEISHGTDGAQLLGRLEHVSGELATVQIRGVIRFKLASGKTAPSVRNGIVVDGAGGVYQSPAVPGGSGDPAGGNIVRGTTIAVYGSTECDVLL